LTSLDLSFGLDIRLCFYSWVSFLFFWGCGCFGVFHYGAIHVHSGNWLRMLIRTNFTQIDNVLSLSIISILIFLFDQFHNFYLFNSIFFFIKFIFIFNSLIEHTFMINGQIFELIFISVTDLWFYSKWFFFVYIFIEFLFLLFLLFDIF